MKNNGDRIKLTFIDKQPEDITTHQKNGRQKTENSTGGQVRELTTTSFIRFYEKISPRK